MLKIIHRFFRWIFSEIPNNQIIARIVCSSPGKLLLGKSIVVTGGGRGLGFEMAKRFKAEGAEVLILGRSAETLKKASSDISCKYLQADVSDIHDFDNIIDKSIEILGSVDCLVNNAGISLHENNVFDVTPESWDKQFDTNLKGPYFLTQKIIKYFLENKKKGNILFISSETGDTCDIRPYGFTKAAINSMVQGLAYRYKLNGIRINAIAPGITASDMTGVGKDGNYYAGDYGLGRFYLPCNNAQTVNARWKK